MRWLNESVSDAKYKVTSQGTTRIYNGSSLYGQGNHSLSVSDVDGDGRDEIVFGSAVVDNDGTVLTSTGHGHGDALHVSDFNNDGRQEVLQAHESCNEYGLELRDAKTSSILYSKETNGDNGYGMIGNFDDEYAASNPDALALSYSGKTSDDVFDLKGNVVGKQPISNTTSFVKGMMYWDGDLGRELQYNNLLAKYSVENGTSRFYANGKSTSFYGADKIEFPNLIADILGDWREEAIFNCSNTHLRMYISALPTDYRLYTLMHDSQYRCAIAWQNVAYAQPPHTSYYIGSNSLAKSDTGEKLNYLAPETAYTKVKYVSNPEDIKVGDTAIDEDCVKVDVSVKGGTEHSVTIYCASYDDNGRLLEVNSNTETINVSTNLSVEKTKETNDMRVFVWTNNMVPCANKRTR